MAGRDETGWVLMLGADPVPWLLASDEPATRWLTLTALLDRPFDDPDVIASHAAALADQGTAALIRRLPDWEVPGTLSGHDSPAFAPNILCLLARMGVGRGDSPVIEALLEAMLRHQEENGRFATLAVSRVTPTGAWGALLCDTHAITEALIRFGHDDAPAVRGALARMETDLAASDAGIAWPCVATLGFRGPGRKADPCPQVTAEALRVFALLPGDRRPAAVVEAARTLLAVWRRRGTSQPYMFGHGLRFKTVKWPPFWYGVLGVLDALGGYPELWRGAEARAEDRRSIAELAACLVAYNVDTAGRVTPQSCYRAFEGFSFGQKKLPSPFATALVAAVLRPFDDLGEDIAAVDVLSLGSSKGGHGTPHPPKPGLSGRPS